MKALREFQVVLCQSLRKILDTLEPGTLRRLSDREFSIILREIRLIMDEEVRLSAILHDLPWYKRLWMHIRGVL